MKEHVASVINSVQAKAENYAAVTKNPQELIGKVMTIGSAAMWNKKFTPQQAEEVAAMMIAALAMLNAQSSPGAISPQ